MSLDFLFLWLLVALALCGVAWSTLAVHERCARRRDVRRRLYGAPGPRLIHVSRREPLSREMLDRIVNPTRRTR